MTLINPFDPMRLLMARAAVPSMLVIDLTIGLASRKLSGHLRDLRSQP